MLALLTALGTGAMVVLLWLHDRRIKRLEAELTKCQEAILSLWPSDSQD